MWIWLVLLVIGVVLFAILGLRKANHDYTLGNALFRNSDNNLQKGEHIDTADYQYYNSDDKLK